MDFDRIVQTDEVLEQGAPFVRVAKVLHTGSKASLWRAYAQRGGKAYVSNVLPARDPKMFCIATTPRTGSELLVRLLNEHPKIRCDSEILNYQPHLPYPFVRGKARAASFRGFHAYGFKLMAYHVMNYYNTPDLRLVTRLADRGCRFVHLRRRDVLSQVLSFFRASISQEWHRGKGGPSTGSALPDAVWKADFAPIAWRLGAEVVSDDVTIGVPLRGPITLDIPTLMFALRLMEIQNNALAWMFGGFATHTLWYEDHLESRDAQQQTVDELCDWIGVDRFRVEPTMVKISSARLEDEIANIDEVRSVLRSTRFAGLVDMVRD